MSRRIRVALAGVGNCASALVQGVTHYADVGKLLNSDPDQKITGLMHNVIGNYLPGDIEFVAAFDVLASKVGLDISEAIYAPPNNTIRFADVKPVGVKVQPAPILDGIGEYLRLGLMDGLDLYDGEPVNVADVLKEVEADVLVNFLPVGSQEATEYFANAALESGTAFVNGIPVFIASDNDWANRFKAAGVPIVGDDVKSQLGATILHRVIAKLFDDRGLKINHTYQLNFGGNTDFLNMLERKRLASKKISKTRAVTSILGQPMEARDVHIGPSDYVPWLEDQKVAMIRIEGENFGGAPVTVDVRLQVWDSPNSAGVMIDAVRLAKLGLDRGLAGPLYEPSAYLMKSPPRQMPDDKAKQAVDRFIIGDYVFGDYDLE